MVVYYSRFGQADEKVAPVLAAEVGALSYGAKIWPSVATGVLVFVATRLIDRVLFRGGKR